MDCRICDKQPCRAVSPIGWRLRRKHDAREPFSCDVGTTRLHSPSCRMCLPTKPNSPMKKTQSYYAAGAIGLVPAGVTGKFQPTAACVVVGVGVAVLIAPSTLSRVDLSCVKMKVLELEDALEPCTSFTGCRAGSTGRSRSCGECWCRQFVGAVPLAPSLSGTRAGGKP